LPELRKAMTQDTFLVAIGTQRVKGYLFASGSGLLR
jgi:hypothetical protein